MPSPVSNCKQGTNMQTSFVPLLNDPLHTMSLPPQLIHFEHFYLANEFVPCMPHLYAVEASVDHTSSLVAGTVVLIYDTLLNLDEEIDLVWNPLSNVTVSSTRGSQTCIHAGDFQKYPRLLEATIRYAMIIAACMSITCTLIASFFRTGYSH